MEDSRKFDGPRPFRSLDSWFTHEGFLRMVKEEWRELGDVQFLDKMKALSVSVRRWHKQQFGNIAEKIRKFEEEIKKVDDMEVFPTLRFRDGLVNCLEREEAKALEVMPSVEEVKEAVWDCESSKAPRSDRYNINFIKKCWSEIGSKFTTDVMSFFETARLPADSNVTWVALVRKFVGAKEIKDLKPINMLKLKRKASLIIKLYFHKAYDRVKWCFVDTVLEKTGFGSTWRTLVKECIRSASISILVNGLPIKAFKMERELCQGDSLSPFLFVLVVDVLNRMIGEAVRNGQISPLLVGWDDIELSHLQFVDGTLLFCPPEEETVRNYKRLLRCFEIMSGLSINFEKFRWIPVNYSQEWTSRMCQMLGC
ncbi:uncharacterized protein LOC107478164 [Arachis duranensis]|uniref:Uncharacterized protein LOC107478164 n=1 Tax=Arachis duranensis TaxID=130453 RepID=A0A6P4CLW5_ARADU|nr:uncharacterized protein LOC107478164 [Arachis duranensis]